MLLFAQFSFAQNPPRSVLDFNSHWKFLLGNDSTAIHADYDDAKWRTLNLPHDWSIEDNFAANNSTTTQGGALPAGIGWYRKTFTLPVSAKNKNVSIEFDGVYRNSEVWINGHYLGKRPNGYISFQYDLTPYIKPAPGKNIMVVKVDNSKQPNSRWYTGSGIYRNVKLVLNSMVAAVAHWRTHITTYDITSKEAWVNIVTVLHSSTKDEKSVSLRTIIFDASGKRVAGDEEVAGSRLRFTGSRMQHNYSTNIFDPKLWSVNRPYLYKAVTQVIHRGKIIDESVARFGIRYFNFDSEKGFSLNGRPFKIHGVCMHHDLGALGSAFNKTAAGRQLHLLKKM